MDINKLKKEPNKFYYLFGIAPHEFGQLIVRVNSHLIKDKLKNQKIKVKTIGSGRLNKCTLEERVAMVLLYEKTYISHSFLSKIFNVHQSRISQYFKKLKPIILTSCDYNENKYKITKKELIKLLE